MLSEQVQATLITDAHLFKCKVATGGQRLQEVLNFSLTTYLHIFDVSVYRYYDPTELTVTFAKATILKSEVNLALIQNETYEAPQRRMYAYIQKNNMRAFMSVADYDVQGYMHFTSYIDPLSFLALDSKNFVPVTQAVINHGGYKGEQLSSPVVLVRRAAISFLHFTRSDRQPARNSLPQSLLHGPWWFVLSFRMKRRLKSMPGARRSGWIFPAQIIHLLAVCRSLQK